MPLALQLLTRPVRVAGLVLLAGAVALLAGALALGAHPLALSMAPAMLVTPQARFVDLDGPLLLARDRDHALRYDDSLVYPPDASLWG